MRTGTEYHCASEKDGYMVWICCSRIWHADALNTLANANRMVAAQYGIRKYSVCRAYFKLKNDKLGSFFHILKMDMRIFLWDPGDFLQDFFLKDSKYQSVLNLYCTCVGLLSFFFHFFHHFQSDR